MFAKTHVPVLGIVENMAWFEDPAGERHFLFGDGGGGRMAQQLGLPLLAQFPILTDLREGGDAGTPAAIEDGAAKEAFALFGDKVASALETLETNLPPTITFED